jgi:alpha-L-fucosidase
MSVASMLAMGLGVVALVQAACGGEAAEPPGTDTAGDPVLAQRLEWFQDLKFGFFMHWGVYSQWGCIESWPLVEADKWARPDDLPAWTERGKDIARFRRDYFALPKTFNPTKFDPKLWARIAKQAGMRYMVFTTKHHDGFSMFDTKQTDFRVTAPDCPFSKSPRADVVRAVFDAFRAEGFGIGAYFSKSDWHSPHYWSPDFPTPDRNVNYDTAQHPELWAKFVAFVHGQVEELMTSYGRVDILWLDGGQVRPPKQDIQMDRLVAMARGHQPNLIVVDRTVGGKHENYRTPEQEVPDQPPPYVWETCMTMGNQWSFKPGDHYKSTRRLIQLLVDIVSKGGNFLLNVGPQPDGQLPAEAVQRLKEIGAWMAVNGEAIYGTRAIAPYKEGRVCLTRKGNTVYAIHLADEGEDGPPEQIVLTTLQPAPGSAVHMLGVKEPLAWRAADAGVVITVPPAVRKSPPCRDAFSFKMTLPARAEGKGE